MPLTSMSRVIGFDGFDVVPCFCKNRCRTSSEKQRMLLSRTRTVLALRALSAELGAREQCACRDFSAFYTPRLCAQGPLALVFVLVISFLRISKTISNRGKAHNIRAM